MREAAVSEEFVKNVNSPFTEIFSLILKYQIMADNTMKLAYSRKDLLIMNCHVSNAVDVMLQGMQEIGNLVAVVDRDKMRGISIDGIGGFISATCNLIEALNAFGKDVEYSI